MAYMGAMANDRAFQMRASEEFLRKIDDWRRRQADHYCTVARGTSAARNRLNRLSLRLKER
jgi:hypothetical protein